MNNIEILAIKEIDVVGAEGIKAFVQFGDDQKIHSFSIYDHQPRLNLNSIELAIIKKWNDPMIDSGSAYDYEYVKQSFHIQKTEERLQAQKEKLIELTLNRSKFDEE